VSDVSKRESNRDRCPEIARVLDAVRGHFPGAKVTAIRPMSEEKKRMLEDYNRKHPYPDNQ
jgi:hypothetical protein